MSRDPSGNYTYPPGTPGSPGTTIFSARYNTFLDDLALTLNTKLPVNMGGTNAQTVVEARSNLKAEVASQTVTDFASHVFEAGSFSADSGATDGPDGSPTARYYIGTAQLLASNPTQYITLRANTSDGLLPALTYVRQKVAGTWGPWVQEGQVHQFGSSYFSSPTADMSYGLTGTSPNSFFFVNSESDASGSTILAVNRAGPVTISSPNSVFVINSNAVGASTDQYFANATVPRWLLRTDGATGDFKFGRFDGGSPPALTDFPLTLSWSTGNATFVRPVNINSPDANPLNINSTGASASLALNNISGPPHASIIVGSSQAKTRWVTYLGDGSTESGSDAGNNFKITSFHDDGSPFSDALTINRADSAITIPGNFKTSGLILQSASDSTPRYVLYSGGFAAALGEIRYDGATGTIKIIHWAGGGREFVFDSDGNVTAGIGVKCRAGVSSGTIGNTFNVWWTGSAAQLWIDTTNQGNITLTSDYRTKKDVHDLDSMWNAVKELRPISYTQAEFNPPSATKSEPMFTADNVERWGFLAHELQETLIESAATAKKDAPDAIQSPNPWTVIAALTKALQEAMARIERLEEMIR